MPPVSTQQLDVVGLSRQLSPVQHADAAAHDVRAAPHDAIAMHVPLEQVSPVVQGAPVPQQDSPRPPQAGAQLLPVHVVLQALSHRPQ